MYDTKQLEELSEVLFSNIEEWENNALTRIGNRVNKVGKLSVADAQALNNLATVKGDLKIVYRELAEVTGKNIREIEKIYGDAVSATHEGNKFLYDYRNKPFVPFEENKKLQAMVRAFAKSTATEMFNLSKTKMLKTYDPITGNTVSLDKAYKKVLDKAVTEVASGTSDFNSAMRQSLKTLGGNGIRVDYGGGVTRRLDTVVRQNLLWGAKQTFMEYSDIIGEEIGADGIEIDAHPFCRPSHEFMQGQQYILGKGRMIDGEYFESADRALEALQDYGCKHHPFSIICGVSVPMHSKEELAELHRRNTEKINIDGVEKTGYEWKQEMRRLETKTRALKGEREILRASGDKEGVKQVNEKMKAIKDKYTKIGEKSGNELRYNRMSVVRKDKGLTNVGGSGIIKPQGGKIMKINNIDSPIEQRNTAKGNPNAIIQFNRPLNNRQQKLLDKLPEYDSNIIVNKKNVNMKDLSALTAVTGDEFALFTKGKKRLVIRGNTRGVNVDIMKANELSKNGFKWSGHTHPGIDFLSMQISDGDISIWECFNQDNVAIYNSKGAYRVYLK